jgi:hypothetical protein
MEQQPQPPKLSLEEKLQWSLNKRDLYLRIASVLISTEN